MFGKTKTAEEKELEEAIENLKRYSKNGLQLDNVVANLQPYLLTDASAIVIRELGKNFLSFLLKDTTPQKEVDIILDFLRYMLVCCPDREKTSANTKLFLDKGCTEVLFGYLSRKIDTRVIEIIDTLKDVGGSTVYQWVAKNSARMTAVFNLVAKTKSVEGGTLLRRLTIGNEKVGKALRVHVERTLANLPISVAIDFAYTDQKLQQLLLHSGSMEKWLTQYDTMNIGDFKWVVSASPDVWTKESCIGFILKTTPCDNFSDAIDIIKQRDALEVVPTDEQLTTCCQQIVGTKHTEFAIGKAGYSMKYPYLFMRLLVISLVSPEKVPMNVINVILDLMNCEVTEIKGAALQVFAIWGLKYDFQLPSKIAYRAADIALAPGQRAPIVYIAKTVLHGLARTLPVAATLLNTIPDMRVGDGRMILRTASYTFKHYSRLVAKFNVPPCHDYNDAVGVLGCIMQYLGDDCEPTSPRKEDPPCTH